MTSSLRNSLHRRNHKERGQLVHRKRWGILEKHADYVKRARDYHAKQDHLKRLRQKAADRNKDEFYFSMTREKTKKGVHVKDRGNVALPTDTVKVLKTQDENYVRTVRTSNLKKIDRIKQNLTSMSSLLKHLAKLKSSKQIDKQDLKVLKDVGILPTAKVSSSHIRFAQDSEPLDPEPVQVDDAPSHLDLGWKTSDSSRSLRTTKLPQVSESLEELDEDQLSSTLNLVKELSARLYRDQQLRYSIREFELQRSMMGKGARKKIEGTQHVGGQKDSDAEDEDALDARAGRPLKTKGSRSEVDEKLYKPRVYKWRRERK